MPIAMMILDHETIVKFGGTINITDDVANLGQNTIGVAITALLKEIDPGEYRVSLRAKYPYDIHEIALKYGGGGHERAAGFNFWWRCRGTQTGLDGGLCKSKWRSLTALMAISMSTKSRGYFPRCGI